MARLLGLLRKSFFTTILPTTPTTIKPNEILFFIYENEPSTTFNLKNYLLVLARLFDQETICYCKNAIHDKENIYKVELVSALSSDFNEVWAEFADITFTFSVPSQLPQSLTRLKIRQLHSFQNSLVAVVV